MERDKEALINFVAKGVSVLLLAGAGYIFTKCDNTEIPKNPVPKGIVERVETESSNNFEDELRRAKKIIIKEKTWSFGKDYSIIVDDNEVATVSGRDFRFLGGDILTLKTLDGKILASEKEHKNFLQMDRVASVYDGNGELTGYIGEKGWRDLFSIGHIFHFYDGNERELGSSKRVGSTAIGKHKIYDNKGNVVYDIDKQFVFVGGDRYVITKGENSIIPIEHTILVTCIEDAIMDAEADD